MRAVYLTTLIALLVSLIPLPSFAQVEESEYVRQGYYVTFSALRAYESFERHSDTGFGPDHQHAHFSDTMGWGSAIGLRYYRTLGSELHFEKLNSFRSGCLMVVKGDNCGVQPKEHDQYEGDYFKKDPDSPLGRKRLKIWTLTSMAKAYYPLMGDQLQPFAMAGLGIINGRFSGPNSAGERATELLWRFGFGLDYYLTPDTGFGIEVARNEPTGELRKHDFWTVNANFIFRFD